SRTGPSPVSLASQAVKPRWILAWVYIGRMSLAAALLLALPTTTSPVVPIFTFVLAFTAISYFVTHRREEQPSQPFLYLQLVFDTVLLTTAVYLTGGQESIFAPLYILVISAGALLLPIIGSVSIGF